MKTEIATGLVGTSLGVIGTATQTNEVLETISLVITILGALISFVIVPILNWWRNAKKDGKITLDEIHEGAEILKDGIDKTTETTKGKKQDEQREHRED